MKDSIFNTGKHRTEITREQYHKNKNSFLRNNEIAAIAQKINNNYFGYRYYIMSNLYKDII